MITVSDITPETDPQLIGFALAEHHLAALNDSLNEECAWGSFSPATVEQSLLYMYGMLAKAVKQMRDDYGSQLEARLTGDADVAGI